MELQIDDVGESVVLGELGACDPLQQRIELGLLVIFLGKQAQLQRQPDKTRVIPLLRGFGAQLFEDLGQALEDEEHVLVASQGDHTGRGEPTAEPPARCDGEGFQRVAVFLATEQCIVRNEHVCEKNLAGMNGELLACRVTARGESERLPDVDVEKTDLRFDAPDQQMRSKVVDVPSRARKRDVAAAPVLVEKRDHELTNPPGCDPNAVELSEQRTIG